MLPLRYFGVWLGILVLLFACVIFWQSLFFDVYSDIGPGPGLFPLWLSGCLAVLSLIYIVRSFTKEKILIAEVFPKGKTLLRVISILVSIFLFIVISPYAGYTIAGIAVLFILLIPEIRWYWALGFSTVVTVALFLLFQLLDVPLPVNAFGW